jgi:hypothetical protein
MERVPLDVEAIHLGFADFDPFLVDPGIECALDFEAGLRCGGGMLVTPPRRCAGGGDATRVPPTGGVQSLL